MADFHDTDAFNAMLGRNCVSDPNYPDPCDCAVADINGSGSVTFADIDAFVGTLGTDGVVRTYTWDAENRLVALVPAKPAQAGERKLTFAYDHGCRRIEKRVYNWDPNLAGGAGAGARRRASTGGVGVPARVPREPGAGG